MNNKSETYNHHGFVTFDTLIWLIRVFVECELRYLLVNYVTYLWITLPMFNPAHFKKPYKQSLRDLHSSILFLKQITLHMLCWYNEYICKLHKKGSWCTQSIFVRFCCFTSHVNSNGHCGTVSSLNHTFSWAGLSKPLTSNLCTYFRL